MGRSAACAAYRVRLRRQLSPTHVAANAALPSGELGRCTLAGPMTAYLTKVRFRLSHSAADCLFRPVLPSGKQLIYAARSFLMDSRTRGEVENICRYECAAMRRL